MEVVVDQFTLKGKKSVAKHRYLIHIDGWFDDDEWEEVESFWGWGAAKYVAEDFVNDPNRIDPKDPPNDLLVNVKDSETERTKTFVLSINPATYTAEELKDEQTKKD